MALARHPHRVKMGGRPATSGFDWCREADSEWDAGASGTHNCEDGNRGLPSRSDPIHNRPRALQKNRRPAREASPWHHGFESDVTS